MRSNAGQSPRSHGAFWALAGSLLFSFLIFGTAPLLLREDKSAGPLPPHSVPIFLPMKSTPPLQEEKQPPPESRPLQEMKVTSLRIDPPPMPSPKLKRPVLELAINPKLQLTPALDAPASPQKAPALAAPAPSKGTPALGEPDRQPMLVRRVPPVYPFRARRRNLEGSVDVRFLVDGQGRVQKLQIIKAQPPGVFEAAVRQSVSAWRFKPGTKKGRPVECWVETTVRFNLEGR